MWFRLALVVAGVQSRCRRPLLSLIILLLLFLTLMDMEHMEHMAEQVMDMAPAIVMDTVTDAPADIAAGSGIMPPAAAVAIRRIITNRDTVTVDASAEVHLLLQSIRAPSHLV